MNKITAEQLCDFMLFVEHADAVRGEIADVVRDESDGDCIEVPARFKEVVNVLCDTNVYFEVHLPWSDPSPYISGIMQVAYGDKVVFHNGKEYILRTKSFVQRMSLVFDKICIEEEYRERQNDQSAD